MTTLRRMCETEFTSWLVRSLPDYAAQKVASGQWTQEESEELSRAEHSKLLPFGLATEGNHFFSIEAATGQTVGMLWFAVQAKFGLPIAYVYQVEIDAEHQRRGYARGAFIALEKEIAAMGLQGIALHVFGHNAGARLLYEGLGFEPTNIHLFKRLNAAA